ncbi:MAG: 16S rRNA (uracil(1498)-N(3))-methyltransferase [Oscillospiraceae bacterium]|jgi:16S rRNA (uracil1498-N3)-methyltransferase|nr:16S rRNA (uracil(1498)-N(3))-methyltransferase [Oscillospiraceae bacterium]
MRFFVDDPKSGTALEKARAHVRALRLKPGEEFTLCDGARRDVVCRVTLADRRETRFEILYETENRAEPPYFLTVYLAYAKGERLEYSVQKCTELGASRFVLFPSRNCVAVPDEKGRDAKLARLAAVVRSAAEQSGRGIIPQVTAAQSFEEAVRGAATAGLPLFPFERESVRTLKSALREAATVSVMTGSEGGFTDAEAEFAVSAGLVSVTLGTRILRCDTAPIAVCAAIGMSS